MQYFNEIEKHRDTQQNLNAYIDAEVDRLMADLTRLQMVPGERAANLLESVVEKIEMEIAEVSSEHIQMLLKENEFETLDTEIDKENESGNQVFLNDPERFNFYLILSDTMVKAIKGAAKLGVQCSKEFISYMVTVGADKNILELLKCDGKKLYTSYVENSHHACALEFGEDPALEFGEDPAPHTYNISKHFIEKIYSKFNDLLVSVAPEQWEEAMLTANFKGVASQCPKQKLAYLISCITYQLGEKGEQWYKDSAKSIDKTPDYCSGRSNKIAKDFKERCDLLKVLSHQL